MRNHRFTIVLAVAALLWPGASPTRAQQARTAPEGEWSIGAAMREDPAPGTVQLSMRYTSERGGFNMTSRQVPMAQLEGLTAAQMASAGTPVRFRIRREAGAFDAEGWFREGRGSGHWTFSADPRFAAELARQGFGEASPQERLSLALHDVGLELVRELARQGYGQLTVAQLVRAGTHGVGLEYLREMSALG